MSMRAYDNDWHDAIMGEIELGSMEAYTAIAWDHRMSDEFNRTNDQGWARMFLWYVFECDDALEEGRPAPTVGPWGPWGDDLGS